jgi:hypothetical protein
MTIENKDFKVKNGLQVAGGATFGGTVTALDPTESGHLATKSYVDMIAAGIPVDSTPPVDPNNGDLWFDTSVERINVYYEGQWMTIATIDDTLTIPDHIHDTSIDGNGLIVTQFVSGGSFNDPQGTPVDGGTPGTVNFSDTYDGGIAIDNYS